MRKLIGITFGVIGIIFLLTSSYIKYRVEQGKGQISEAQHKVNRGKTLFSAVPGGKSVGKGFTGAIQKKIDAGKEEIALYARYAIWIQIGGSLCIALGAGILLIHKKS